MCCILPPGTIVHSNQSALATYGRGRDTGCGRGRGRGHKSGGRSSKWGNLSVIIVDARITPNIVVGQNLENQTRPILLQR